MSKFLNEIQNLPFITEQITGIGGQIKLRPEHFVVEEIPLYECSDEGEHVYVRVTREGHTTRFLQKEIASLFGLAEAGVGYAGLKDKHARVTQTFSIHLHGADPGDVARRLGDSLPVEVHWTRRHRNKLKPGHLLGNTFRIVISDPVSNALERAEEIARLVQQLGLPNYYGEQRFGFKSDNAQKGLEVLFGRGPRERWLRRFLLSALQGGLFNLWLAERIRRGIFVRLLKGDVAKKTDTGGLFDVDDVEAEAPRFASGEITYTGPIFGGRMRRAEGEPGELEKEVLQRTEVTTPMFQKVGARGSRRVARLRPDDLRIESHPEGLCLSVTLPKGAYATTLLREIMKETQSAEPEESDPDGTTSF
jgi:tRNA pseudouridine13 synthase